ncbi:sodium-dependent transporter [Ihubacter sp. mB4P-1]|uniref:sodium-dependent transporter n=1 Tax=Ihubacter sp. mB4P-1 TaxID=3242370 RepID=UPI00137B893D
MNNNEKSGFGSIFGFLMTMIGFAVGVGSLWRFPYVCGTNGGALFIFVYVIVILVVGIPLLTAEMSIGYASQRAAVGAYKALEPEGSKWHLAGYVHLFAGWMINCYTIPIYAWIVIYIYRTATGYLKGMTPTEVAQSFDALNEDHLTMFIGAVICWGILALIVSRGLQGGVEKINKVLIPLLGVIMIVCIIIGVRLPGAEKGVAFLFKPDASGFGFSSVTAALGQAFFAIGIGMLASMVFGSCIRTKGEKLVKDSSIICLSIIIAGIFAGLMIFPICFAFDLEPAAGTGLSMITLPNAFNAISGGNIIGTVFYVGFFCAALSSSIGMAESVVNTLMELLKCSRMKALAISLAANVAIGSVSIMSLALFDKMDIFVSNYVVVIGALVISVFVGWIWGIDKAIETANIQNAFLQKWFKISVKYICPIAISIIFLGNFIQF